LIIHETYSHSYFQGEFFQDVIDDSVMDSMTTNLLDCHNEIFVPKDQVVHLCSFFGEHNEKKIVNFKIQIFFIVDLYIMNMKMEKSRISHQHSLAYATVSPFFYEYESDIGEID
jgi:hypothetical protein